MKFIPAIDLKEGKCVRLSEGKQESSVVYNKDPVKFINSLVSPIKVEDITLSDNVINLKVRSAKDRGLLIGRNGKNIESINMKEKRNLLFYNQRTKNVNYTISSNMTAFKENCRIFIISRVTGHGKMYVWDNRVFLD